ncbi:tRNA uridine-5-carboxymethylaminomethyl(34) synthesis GTPase MnmE [bacterium]|nr:tRNA uridine-5-carboxymethylaminomethyl(34) synthesis GTPase MnmE [bacterium]
MNDDTIIAVATPPGRGAIGIVRLSGTDARAIAGGMFAPRAGAPLAERPACMAVLGRVTDGDDVIDHAIAVAYRAPRSYTGEDVVEISCHGGPAVLERVIGTAMRLGARPAAPGEFTRRAFLNGKIDLTQAEAVADLIAAPTDRVRSAALRQLEGAFGTALEPVRAACVALLAELEAGIDFPEDAGETFDGGAMAARIEPVAARIASLADGAAPGRMLRDGFTVVIAGRPNTGKSSLLNRLAREERALVTPIAGTTRDAVEADVNVDGFPVRLIDTAGVRAAKGAIERKGIERTHAAMNACDLVLWVADRSRRPARGEVEDACTRIGGRNAIWVWNKMDAPPRWPAKTAAEVPAALQPVAVSALTGDGMHALHQRLAAGVRAAAGAAEESGVLVRARHRALLDRAARALRRARETSRTRALPELVAADVREALNAVGEITGVVTSDDVLDRIFAEFCIGK